MSDKKRVLIVDDNYETLDFLRSTLELSSIPFEVAGVPSAEEGWLEMLQGNVDLALIDLRLPGMSGGEFLSRIRRNFPNLPTIVMSGYNLEWMKQETAGMSVFRLLEKPFSLEQVLEVVEAAISGSTVTNTAPTTIDPGDKIDLSNDLRRRLEKLRQDTGARRLLLGSLQGDLFFWSGQAAEEYDEPKLVRLIGRNLQGTQSISAVMGGENSLTVQVLTSPRFEVYIANIGRDFFMTLFYPTQSQRARIGTIWVFLQRAIRDLEPLLPDLPFDGDEKKEEEEKDKDERPAADEPRPTARRGIPKQEPEPAKTATPKVEPEPVSEPGPALSLEEALAQGLVSDELSGVFDLAPAEPDEPETIDLFADLEELPEDELVDILALTEDHSADPEEADAFWKAVVTGDTEGTLENGQLDEALEKGLAVSARLDTDEKKSSRDYLSVTADELETLADLNLLNIDENSEDELDAFWDDAMSEISGESSEGLSFEEAQEQGLVPEEKEKDQD